MPRRSAGGTFRSCFAATAARSSSSATGTGLTSTRRLLGAPALVGWRAMRRSVGRTAVYGILFGLATAAVAEAVRPRGGTTLLVDWDDVRRAARSHLDKPHIEAERLTAVALGYRSLAGKLERPLLNFVGPLPKGSQLPQL